MEGSLRTFIAVALTPDLRQALIELEDKFKELELDVKWVKPDNAHVTLKFLGHIPPKKIHAIMEIFPEIYDSIPSFDVRLEALGAFPSIHRPRVIWAGLADPEERLKSLAARTEEILCRLGFAKEQREFASHITLGRLRSPKNLPRLTEALEQIQLPRNIQQHIDKVTLFKSTLTPKGPVYDPLLVQELRGISRA